MQHTENIKSEHTINGGGDNYLLQVQTGNVTGRKRTTHAHDALRSTLLNRKGRGRSTVVTCKHHKTSVVCIKISNNNR